MVFWSGDPRVSYNHIRACKVTGLKQKSILSNFFLTNNLRISSLVMS